MDINFNGQPINLSGQDTLNGFELIELAKKCMFAGNLADQIVEKVKKADANTKYLISQNLAKSIVGAIMEPIMPAKDKDEAM